MPQVNLSLPPALKDWVDTKVAEGRYASASDYVRDLVRRDQDNAANDIEWVKGMLAEGEASGIINKDPRDVLREIIAEYPADRG
jgi:antitoxin ParD1/3/4